MPVYRTFIVVTLAACPLATIARGACAGATPPAVVAVVNGREIHRAGLERRIAQSRSMNPKRFDSMSPEQRAQATWRVLWALVTQELEYQEALRQRIVVPEEEIDKRLAEELKNFRNEQDFEQFLAEGQITVAEWKQETRRVLMVDRLEEKAAGGIPRAKWLEQRPAWLRALIGTARIWTWQPEPGQAGKLRGGAQE